MAGHKVSTFIALTFILLGCFAASNAQADNQWVTLTSFNEVRRMKLIDDTVYMATSGGLLVAADPDQTPQMYSNLNGLGSIDIYDVIKDAEGRHYVAGFGRLAMLSSDGNALYPFVDNDSKPFKAYALADDGDFIWVGTAKGLVLFSKLEDGGQIQDSYTQFGDLNAQPEVFDIVIDGDSIWLATSGGLAVADKSDPVALKAPTAWTVFGPSDFPMLGTGGMGRLAKFESTIYLAADLSVFRLDRSVGDTTFTELAIGQDSAFSDLKVENDTLFMYYTGGLGIVKGGTASRLTLTGLPSQNLSTGLNTGSYRWVDLLSGSIHQNQSGTFSKYLYTGAPGNTVNEIAVNRTGLMTAALFVQQIGQYQNGSWVQRLQPPGAEPTISLITDSTGDFWFGTFGNGMWRISGDSMKNFDENNSTLRGNNDGVRGRSYVVVKGIATDGEYLFAACYRALNGHPMAVCRMSELDTPSAWDSIGIPQGVIDTFVTTIDCIPGSVVVGTEGDGIYWCTNSGSGDWMTDAFINTLHMTKENRFLHSNAIRVVKFAPDGSLYVGTNFGISWYDYGIEFFVDIDLPPGVSSDITDLDFDSRGNMWVATKDGAARRDAISGSFDIYTTENSGLVSNDVRSVTVDKFSGDIYFGTSSGVSVLQLGIGQPTLVLDSVFAYPNPFVINDENDKVSFNYLKPYTAAIYDVSGALIKDNILSNSWDGRNESGIHVASGVYIFVLTDEEGNATRGKILLVNNQ